LVDFFTYMSLLYHGFHFHRLALKKFFTLFPFRPQTLLTTKRSPVTHLPYWHRKHTSKTKLPILFIHGIGIGLFPYVDFLADLNSTAGIERGAIDDQVGIIAIEILPVSFRITHPAMSKSDMCAEIAKILAHHGWDKVVLVSHSYGTVIATHLIKTPSTAHLVGPMVLIDPVCILLHLPDVAYNFTRRKPRRANEHQLYYFASMDMGVSHTLSRHFFWSENILWKEDLDGRNVTVSLSGKDLIVDTESVGRYMTSGYAPWTSSATSSALLIDVDDIPQRQTNVKGMNAHSSSVDSEPDEEIDVQVDAWKEQPWKGEGIDVLWFENQDHAQVFDKAATRRPLLRAVKTYCAEGGNE
jgi:pimeloyl-ACP methyl ester carboxylesterase